MKRIFCILTILIFLSLGLSGCISNPPKEEYTIYTYDISIDTAQNAKYTLILSTPKGWDDFLECESDTRGQYTFHFTTIGAQPAINLNGNGSLDIRFKKTVKEDRVFTFIDNWYSNGTTKIFLERETDNPIKIRMEYIHMTDRDINGYLMDVTLFRDGWQYVELILTEI